MSQSTDRPKHTQVQGSPAAQQKRPYATPRVERYGNLRDVTRGGRNNSKENASAVGNPGTKL